MKQWLTGAFVLALFSCTNHTKIPSDIIPQDKMKEVFLDMMLADRYASFLSIKDSLQLKQETFTLYSQVFDIHHITEKEFKKSYLFYMGRPDLSIALFDSVASLGERKRNEYYAEKIKKDSIRLREDTLNIKNLLKRQKDSISAIKDSLALTTDSLYLHSLLRKRLDSTASGKAFKKRRDAASPRPVNSAKP